MAGLDVVTSRPDITLGVTKIQGIERYHCRNTLGSQSFNNFRRQFQLLGVLYPGQMMISSDSGIFLVQGISVHGWLSDIELHYLTFSNPLVGL